jgi:hypothetical protein
MAHREGELMFEIINKRLAELGERPAREEQGNLLWTFDNEQWRCRPVAGLAAIEVHTKGVWVQTYMIWTSEEAVEFADCLMHDRASGHIS